MPKGRIVSVGGGDRFGLLAIFTFKKLLLRL
jgi:hypothetical protein